MKRVGLISDTHGYLHPDVFGIFEGMDEIWHAGDVCGEEILDELEAIAPTLAVQGNCDWVTGRLPPLRRIDRDFGVGILTHSHLVPPGAGSPERLVRHFGGMNPRVIVFGHTHQAYAERHDGVLVINPGPAGRPRFRDEPSVCVLEWDEGTNEFEFRFVPLAWVKSG